MFTNEHEFDASVTTLIDEGSPPLREDVIVTFYDDQVTIEQHDERAGGMVRIVLSPGQFQDLRTALNLPEGSYRRKGDT